MAKPVKTSEVISLNVQRIRFFCASFFLASALVYTLSRIISGIELPGLFRSSMFSAILIELLTIKMDLPKISASPEVINAVLNSPSLPHLTISIFLWFNPIYLFQMLSMAITYAFLALEYAQTDDLVLNHRLWKTYGRTLSDLLIPRKPLLMNASAHLKILNLIIVLSSILRFKGNLIHLLVFLQYLASQYISSPSMNQAVRLWDSIISRLLNDPRCPPLLKAVDQNVRVYLNKLVSFTTQYVKPEQKGR